MLNSELLELISQGEGATLEFKRAEGLRPENLAKAIVAFANMNGGTILIGVENDGSITGDQRPDSQTWLMDTVIRRHVHPAITPSYERVMMADKTVSVVAVPMGAAKPYAVLHNDRTDIYVRRGDTSQLAAREEILRLSATGGMLSIEKMPLPGCSIDELDDYRVKSYFHKILDCSEQEWQAEKDEILLNQNFMQADNSLSSAYVTCFACALFAQKPRRYLPQAGMRLIVYENKREDEARDVLLDEILDVPFLGVDWKDRVTNLPDIAINYIKPHISSEYLNAEESAQRKTLWDYPPSVIRELIANAFAHRDWINQNQVEIVVYADCLEFTSPGALPNGMTVKKVKAGQRMARNHTILNILRDCGFVESRGMGIRRRVIPEMKQENGCEPIFETDENYFRVVLPRKR